jgi:hypothetical protein
VHIDPPGEPVVTEGRSWPPSGCGAWLMVYGKTLEKVSRGTSTNSVSYDSSIGVCEIG